jgi:hypothetical protein
VVLAQYTVLVMCADEKQQLALLERFAAAGLECKALLSQGEATPVQATFGLITSGRGCPED